MEAKTKDLWVFVETKEDGSAKNVGIELLSPGRTIADKQGGALVALVVGCGVDQAVEEAATHGADKVVVVDGEEFKEYYTTEAFVNMLTNLRATQAENVEGDLTIEDIYEDTFAVAAINELVP